MKLALACLLFATVPAFCDTLYTISDASTGGLIVQFDTPSSTQGDFTGVAVSNYGAWSPASGPLTSTRLVDFGFYDGWNTTGPASRLMDGTLDLVEAWAPGCLTNPQTASGCDSDGEDYWLNFEFANHTYEDPGEDEYVGWMGPEGLLDESVTLTVTDPPTVPEPATVWLVLGVAVAAAAKKGYAVARHSRRA